MNPLWRVRRAADRQLVIAGLNRALLLLVASDRPCDMQLAQRCLETAATLLAKVNETDELQEERAGRQTDSPEVAP